MATVFNTSNAKSQREDLANFISNIVRDETPFVSSIGKTTSKALLHEWSTDQLAAPGDNSTAEGAGFPGTVTAGPEITRLNNKCQIFTKSIEVSGSIEAVDKAGRKSEFKYQSEKRGKELMRDIEWAVTTGKAVKSTSGNRKMGGFQSWVPKANTVDAAGGTLSGGAGDGSNLTATNSANKAAFSLSQVDQAMQNCYENGGRPSTLMMSPRVKRLFSAAAQGQAANGNVRRNIDDSGKLRQSVEIYETDFGVVKVIPNYIMGTTGSGAGAAAGQDTNVLVYDASTFKMATLRPLHHRDISEDGDRLRALMVHETTLECVNPAANGLIMNLA